MGSAAHRLIRHLPLFAFLALGGVAVAQSIDNGGRDIPYVGYLEEDGFPVDGVRDMRVRVFPVGTGGSVCHNQTFDGVTVAAGQFSLELTDLPDSCLVTGELWLALHVGPTGEALTALSTGVGAGRVRVGAVPFAAANPAGSSLLVGDTGRLTFEDPETGSPVHITGDDGRDGITIEGRTAIDGRLSALGFLAVTGNMSVGGTVTDLLHVSYNDDVSATGADGSLIIGSTAGANIGIDNNEIMARNGAAASTLHLQDEGGTVRIGNSSGASLRVNGIVRWNCPGNMSRVGTHCIDDAVNTAASLSTAAVTCHDEGKDICSVDALMTCDQLGTTRVTSDCATLTDSGGVYWTSGTAYDGYGAGALFDQVACYNADNSIDRCDSNGTNRQYWCCVPGVRGY
jgi:hypothetical protein